MVEEGQKIVQN
jgi:hypothetical protein